MLNKFTMAALDQVDGGRIAQALDREVARCQEDCHDRPTLDKVRKVTLTVEVRPVPNDSGSDLASVDVQFKIKPAALPAKETRSFNMLPRAGGLLVNELSPDESRQLTLDEDEHGGVTKRSDKKREVAS